MSEKDADVENLKDFYKGAYAALTVVVRVIKSWRFPRAILLRQVEQSEKRLKEQAQKSDPWREVLG